MSGGGPSGGGGSTRAGAGVTDFPQKPFELHRREAHQRPRRDSGPAPMNVCGTPFGPNANPPAVRSRRVSPT